MILNGQKGVNNYLIFILQLYRRMKTIPVLLKSLTGYEVDAQNFDVSQGITISFWAKLSRGTRELCCVKMKLGINLKL